MFKKYSRYVILIIGIVTAIPVWSAEQFSRLYVFGDSVSDTGNLASITQPFPAPFFNNRVSNGPNAVDVVAQQLGLAANPSLHLIGPALGTNYAVAGARAGGSEAIDLATQVSSFLFNLGGSAPDDALYIVFIGGNDVRDARDMGKIKPALRSIINAVSSAGRQIQTLIDAGARHIMVFNVADIGRLPDSVIAAQAANNNRLIRRATNFSRLYNILLKFHLRALEHRNHLDIIEFDFFNEFTNLLDNPTEFEFTNSTQACFSQITFTFNPDCNFGVNFPQFVFFDEIHPTARVHVLLGNLATKEIHGQLNKKRRQGIRNNKHPSRNKVWR